MARRFVHRKDPKIFGSTRNARFCPANTLIHAPEGRLSRLEGRAGLAEGACHPGVLGAAAQLVDARRLVELLADAGAVWAQDGRFFDAVLEDCAPRTASGALFASSDAVLGSFLTSGRVLCARNRRTNTCFGVFGALDSEIAVICCFCAPWGAFQ